MIDRSILRLCFHTLLKSVLRVYLFELLIIMDLFQFNILKQIQRGILQFNFIIECLVSIIREN